MPTQWHQPTRKIVLELSGGQKAAPGQQKPDPPSEYPTNGGLGVYRYHMVGAVQVDLCKECAGVKPCYELYGII